MLFRSSILLQHRLFISEDKDFFGGVSLPTVLIFSGLGSANHFLVVLRLGYARLRRVGGILHLFSRGLGGRLVLYIYLGVGWAENLRGFGRVCLYNGKISKYTRFVKRYYLLPLPDNCDCSIDVCA